jgi:hypothetical protein
LVGGTLADTGIDATSLSVLLPTAVVGGLAGIILMFIAARRRPAHRE